MARSAVFALAACALMALAAAQTPSPAGASTDPRARCLIFFEGGALQDNSTKTCLDCQIQCVGLNDGQCGSYSWNGTVLRNPQEAPIFQCATLPVPNDPAIGTCAFFAIGQLYPTTFSLKYCDDCRALCVGDASCDRIAWAGNVLRKGAELLNFRCPPRPSPRPSSPAIPVVPSPAVLAPKASPAVAAAPSPCQNAYAYISATPSLSTLRAAIDAAGLATALQNASLVGTLFAPTNGAFDAVFAALGTNAAAVLANTELLTTVLSFHFVPNVAAVASSLTNGQQLPTLLGPTPTINVAIVPPAGPTFGPTGTGVRAGVVTADVRTCGVVVHVINQVLVPPS